jgi:hypothetical protein
MMSIKVVKAHRSVTVFDTDAEEWEVTIPEPIKRIQFPTDEED